MFLGAFIPIAGTINAGVIAVLVTMVTTGIWAGVIMLAVVVVVMQLEGNVLQPLLLGHALRLPPLAVVLAIPIGTITASVAGALLAVPLLAVLVSGVRSLQGNEQDSETDTNQRRPRTTEQRGTGPRTTPGQHPG